MEKLAMLIFLSGVAAPEAALDRAASRIILALIAGVGDAPLN